jgi:hypothetical protein
MNRTPPPHTVPSDADAEQRRFAGWLLPPSATNVRLRLAAAVLNTAPSTEMNRDASADA